MARIPVKQWVYAAVYGSVLAACLTPRLSAARDRSASVDYDHDVMPILADNCYHCHGPDEKARHGKLRLDTREGAFRLKDGKAVIIPGKAQESELVQRVSSTDSDEQMPPPKSNRKLTPTQIQTLTAWVAQGAKWETHWSFVAPKRPELPAVKRQGWVRNPIDAFVLAKLEQQGLSPSPQASKEALIRRVTLGLTGLPPTLKEVDDFLVDDSPGAYEKVVDRLLASPHYGERMAWEWLDAARYADTNGYQGDNTRTMWPWRDWVIKSFNDNLPFDQFTIDQLAGDLLPNATREQKLATGFCRNHMINGEGGSIAEENRVNYVMDQSETVGTVWLGLTVGCCRCHDHKFDPITQKEYYQLFAFFNNTPVDGGDGSGQAGPVLEYATLRQDETVKELDREIKERANELSAMEEVVFPHDKGQTPGDSPKAAELAGNIAAALKQPPEKRDLPALKEVIHSLKDKEPKYTSAVARFLKAQEDRNQLRVTIPRVMVMQELLKPRQAFILTKGAYDKRTEEVFANVPAVLPPLPAEVKHDRLALARWLVSPEHPLTARVTVNRFWQQFFGTGIVKTVDDFGAQGEKPINPQLLDWLAVEFRESGWDMKRLVRLIVTSDTYCQSAHLTSELAEMDPENRLCARGPRFRLPAFLLRDQALAVSGLLVEKLGGPGVNPYQPAGIWEEATFGQIKYEQDHGDALHRRSIYTFWRRIVGPTEFFDTSMRQSCTVKQSRTNTPLQALTLLNDTTYVEAARAMAQRAIKEGGSTADDRVDFAFRLATARRPSKQERDILLGALARLKDEFTADKPAAQKLLAVGESKRDESIDAVEHAAYTGVCEEILNLDETVTQ